DSPCANGIDSRERLAGRLCAYDGNDSNCTNLFNDGHSRFLLVSGPNCNMKIVDAKVIVCSPGRNFVTLKIVTEDGIYGLGDATLNGRELAVASYLSDHIVPLLIGRDARRIEDTWQYLYTGAYWRRGPVTMTAISAVDSALWDIQGKALHVPVYQLLGGPSREAVL